MLIRLSNGEWIDPRTIVAIKIKQREPVETIGQARLGGNPPRVIITTQHGSVHVCMCDDDDQAHSMADEVAAKANTQT